MGTLASRNVFDYAFGPLTADTTVSMNPYDLSHAEALVCELIVSAAATAAGDILDVRIQNTFDGTYWNTVIRFDAILGNVTEPEIRRATVNQVVDLASTEEQYETTDSTGATDISAGTVRNGPFPPPYKTAAGRQPNWRVFFDITSASAPSFTGTLKIAALGRY